VSNALRKLAREAGYADHRDLTTDEIRALTARPNRRGRRVEHAAADAPRGEAVEAAADEGDPRER
jgi:hypothetical protein